MKPKYYLAILPLISIFLSQNLFATESIEMAITTGMYKEPQQSALFIAVKGLEQSKSFYIAKWKNELFYKAILIDFNGKAYIDKFISLKRYYVPIGQRVDFHEYIEYSVSLVPNSRFADLVSNERYLLLAVAKDAESNKLVFSNLVSFYLNDNFEVTDLKNIPLPKAPEKVKPIIKESILKEFDTNRAEISEQIQATLELE